MLFVGASTDDFKDIRRFHTRTGYTEEARVRDFYKDGEDKVVFWKSLQPDERFGDRAAPDRIGAARV